PDSLPISARPNLVEVFLDEISALVVDGLDQSCRLSWRRAASDQPLHFVFVGRIDEDVKRIPSILQKKCGSAADDDALPFVRGRVDNLLRKPDDDIGVE